MPARARARLSDFGMVFAIHFSVLIARIGTNCAARRYVFKCEIGWFDAGLCSCLEPFVFFGYGVWSATLQRNACEVTLTFVLRVYPHVTLAIVKFDFV